MDHGIALLIDEMLEDRHQSLQHIENNGAHMAQKGKVWGETMIFRHDARPSCDIRQQKRHEPIGLCLIIPLQHSTYFVVCQGVSSRIFMNFCTFIKIRDDSQLGLLSSAST